MNSITDSIKVDIAIIGAGVIGSALAANLAELGLSDVVVIDPDLDGTHSSSELNAGGVRATFNQEINILCSKLTIDYLEKHATDTGYRPVGYLWIHRDEGMRKSEGSLTKWNKLGWPVEKWSIDQLRGYAPFIDQTDDLAGALYGKRDGLVNPNLMKLHFRDQARKSGVRFLNRARLAHADVSKTGIRLVCDRLKSELSSDEKVSLFSGENHADINPAVFLQGQIEIQAKRVVNCAGPWAAWVARMLGYKTESRCVRRQVSLFDCREVDMNRYGMMIDPSGVYFHPEGTNIMSGIAVRDEPPGVNFEYEGESFFQERIWMPLSERSSKFQALRHVTGWAGLYEISPDESAIIGEVSSGALQGAGRIYESHSYSGHGIMHSYACGRALAERIVHGRYETLDLEMLSGSRFESGRLVQEAAVI